MSLPGLLPQGDVASAPSGSYMKRSKEAERRHACGVVWAAGGKQDAEAERMRLTRSLPAESVKQLLEQWNKTRGDWWLCTWGELQPAMGSSMMEIPLALGTGYTAWWSNWKPLSCGHSHGPLGWSYGHPYPAATESSLRLALGRFGSIHG